MLGNSRSVSLVTFSLLLACELDTKDDDGVATANQSDSDDQDEGEAGDGESNGDSDPDGSGNPGSGGSSAGEGGSSAGSGGGSETDGGEGETGTNDTGEPGDVEIWELRAGGYAPPVVETKYSCFSFSFPTDQLRHIIAIDPVVSSPLIHHYVLSIADSHVELDPDDPCMDWPAHILWAWAPGVEPIELPAEAGFLVGDQGPEVTFILQVHYNNPLLMPFEDNDGVDLHVTRTLRPERAGVFTQGDILSIYVPPGDPSFEYVATCSGEVTADLMTQPVHVFASLLHAHAIGTALWTDVERDGASIGEISRDDPFTFNTQQFQPANFDLQPGDRISTHCMYDSSMRDTPTQGGEESDEEMCLNFMMYYPWMPAESCGVL